MHRFGQVALYIALGMALLFLDFASKAYIYYVFPFINSYAPQGYPIFSHFFGIDFSIEFVLNRGAAWGMFAQYQSLLLGVRIAIIVGMLSYLFFINRNARTQLPWILIISGAIGNIVDFFLYDSVVDFLHFNLWGYDFPTFNFADSFITIGVIGLLLSSFFARKTTPIHQK